MGWEQRGNQWYYYRKKRIGRQVFSQYIGPDDAGHIAELEDALERTSQQLGKADQRAVIIDINQLRQLDRPLCEAENRIRLLIKAAYLANGYHTHRRQWRRRRKK